MAAAKGIIFMGLPDESLFSVLAGVEKLPQAVLVNVINRRADGSGGQRRILSRDHAAAVRVPAHA